jgi:hypothetical protein
MTTTIFYFSQAMLQAYNTGAISGSYGTLLQPAVRGKIKSVQFAVDDFDPSSYIYYPVTVQLNPSLSFLELIDGTKYYFSEVYASNYIFTQDIIQISTGTLQIPYAPNGTYVGIWFGENGGFGLELDPIEMDSYFNLSSSPASTNGYYVFEQTPVVWNGEGSGGSGGGGGQPSTPAMFNGKYVMTAEADPTQTELLVGGLALPTGSVVKVGSQKFLKIAGNSMAFAVIPQTPPAEWGWDSSGDSAWAVLQGL